MKRKPLVSQNKNIKIDQQSQDLEEQGRKIAERLKLDNQSFLLWEPTLLNPQMLDASPYPQDTKTRL